MGLQETDVIDAAASDDASIVLIIIDAFEWNSFGLDDLPDDEDHMDLLMEKINTCLGFWESGQIYEQFPGEEDKQTVIRVIGLYEPNERAQWFYDGITKKLAEVDIVVEFELDDEEESIEARREFEERIREHARG